MKIRNAGVMLSVMVLFGACQASGGGSGGDVDPPPPPDIVAPETSGGGTVSLSLKKANSLSISWSAATDAVTVTGLLQYAVYRSTSNNIATLSDAVANGTLALAWTANATSAVISGLSPATDYYISVFVRDEAGNSTPYSTLSEKTLSPVTITWVNLQYPSSIATTLSVGTEVYGQYYAVGITDTNTVSPAVVAQLGWYKTTETRADARYADAAYNLRSGNNHEYKATTGFTSAGTYKYFFRFSGDSGTSWIYTDENTATITP